MLKWKYLPDYESFFSDLKFSTPPIKVDQDCSDAHIGNFRSRVIGFLPSAAANRSQNRIAVIVLCYHKGKRYIYPLIFYRKSQKIQIYTYRYAHTHTHKRILQSKSDQSKSDVQQALLVAGIESKGWLKTIQRQIRCCCHELISKPVTTIFHTYNIFLLEETFRSNKFYNNLWIERSGVCRAYWS